MTIPYNALSTKMVRKTVADTLNVADIPGLVRIHRSKPYVDVWATSGFDDGTVIGYVFIPEQQEIRVAMNGPDDGRKELNYAVDLILYFRDSDKDWAEAQDHYDDIVDQIRWQIRGFGRTLQRPDVILTAGEWTQGIRHQQTEPEALDGGKITIRGILSFEVTVILET